MQLKSTTRANVTDAHVVYDLDADCYEDLRDPGARAPRLLVVLVMPKEEADWLSQTSEELILRHCAYWLSLKGMPTRAASSTVRVSIPLGNAFTATALRTILERIRRGLDP